MQLLNVAFFTTGAKTQEKSLLCFAQAAQRLHRLNSAASAKMRDYFLPFARNRPYILIRLNILFQRILPLSLQLLYLSTESQTKEALPTMWSSGTKPQKRESAEL